MLFFGYATGLNAQTIPQKGVPLMESFTPADYQHQGKIWDVDHAPNGMIYLGSDKGLLEYDGEKWSTFQGPKGIIRAVVVENDSTIYTGSDLDFGVWKKNKYAEFEYTSLYPFKEDLTEISEEFWNVHVLNKTPLFISERNIYVYKDGNLTKIPAPNRITESFQLDDQIYLVDESEGIFKLEGLSPRKVFDVELNYEIVGMFENEGELIFVSQNEGLLRLGSDDLEPVATNISEDLKSANVFSFEQIGTSYLAFGTILNGIYITDHDGNLLHHINKGKGLQNNTILSLHYSPYGKLWAGLDYGLSSIDLGYNYTIIYDNDGDFGTAYTAILKDEVFYIGTNQGLYTAAWQDLDNSNEFYDFELIPGTEGQVWRLNIVNDQILMSHDRGLFLIYDQQVERVGNQRGIWTVEKYQEHLFAGTYNGISIFQRSGNTWQFVRQMELIAGSCNQVLVNKSGSIWVNIPTFGVIRADLNEDLYPEDRKIFNSEQFSGEDHYIEKVGDTVFVITTESRYQFDQNSGTFVKKTKKKSNSRIEDQLLRNGRSVALNERFDFFPVYNGFALKDASINESKPDTTFELIFSDVWAFNNDQRLQAFEGQEISYQYNNIRVQAIVPNQENVEYQFRTDDVTQWTEKSPENRFEILDLSYGDHIIESKAYVNGVPVEIASWSVKILPPWYRTWYAYGVYLILVIVVLYLSFRWIQSSMAKQRKDLLIKQRESLKKQKERFQERLKKVEREKLRAEYENLKSELKNKTIELATKAKENDEKNKVLEIIKDKFQDIEDNPPSLKRKIGEIKQIIKDNISEEEDNTFEIQIDELHQDFFDHLREEFPELTRYDLRLCAYIKLGFDSKEIADLLNIKPSSVYISRSRLRKKLDIESDQDLHSYLNSV